MTEAMRAFAELLRSAEAAASRFDGPQLNRASDALTAHVELLLQGSLTPEEFAYVGACLTSWRDTCSFLQQTLHDSLLHAAAPDGPVGYAQLSSTKNATSFTKSGATHLQPLLRRYA